MLWAGKHAGRNRQMAPAMERRIAPGRDRAASETEACAYKIAVTIIYNGRVETMARAIPDGICLKIQPRHPGRGAKKTHTAGPARITKRGDRGGDLAALGTPPACHARAAAIELQ